MHAAFKAFGKQLVNTVTGKSDVSVNQNDSVLNRCKDDLVQLREELLVVQTTYTKWAERMNDSCETGVELSRAIKSFYDGSTHVGRTKLVDYFDKAQQNIASDTYTFISNQIMSHEGVCGELSEWLDKIESIESKISNCEKSYNNVITVNDKLYSLREQYTKKKNTLSGLSPGGGSGHGHHSGGDDGSSNTVGGGSGGSNILGGINLNMNYGSSSGQHNTSGLETELEELNHRINEMEKRYENLQKKYENDRSQIKKKVSQMLNDKHVTFDRIYVDILESQYNFYRNCTNHVTKFERGINHYRKQFPKNTNKNNNNNNNNINNTRHGSNENDNMDNKSSNNNNNTNNSNNTSNKNRTSQNNNLDNPFEEPDNDAVFTDSDRGDQSTRKSKSTKLKQGQESSNKNETTLKKGSNLVNGSKNLLSNVTQKSKQFYESRNSNKSKSRKSMSKSARSSPQPQSRDHNNRYTSDDLPPPSGTPQLNNESSDVFGDFVSITSNTPHGTIDNDNSDHHNNNNNHGNIMNGSGNKNQNNNNSSNNNNNNNKVKMSRQNTNLLGDFEQAENYSNNNDNDTHNIHIPNGNGNNNNNGNNSGNLFDWDFGSPQASPGQQSNDSNNMNTMNNMNNINNNHNNKQHNIDGNMMDPDDGWGDFRSPMHNDGTNSAPNPHINMGSQSTSDGGIPNLMPDFGTGDDTISEIPNTRVHKHNNNNNNNNNNRQQQKSHNQHANSNKKNKNSYNNATNSNDTNNNNNTNEHLEPIDRSQLNREHYQSTPVMLSEKAKERARRIAQDRYNEIQEQYAKADQELADRDDAIDKHGDRIEDWEYDPSNHQRRNLRTLLVTLPNVLWHNSGWKPVTLSQLLSKDQLGKHYKKACRLVHPDRAMQRGDSVEIKTICERIFEGLNAAWATEYGKNSQ